ncbi:hypothetical protein AB1L30_13855 [Bremerella sp. JC817]|uniref:hypothetical protein n=1 Tax=Bremerella sp. JC817 TaxID=3231756 RepID=UPI00345A639D
MKVNQLAVFSFATTSLCLVCVAFIMLLGRNSEPKVRLRETPSSEVSVRGGGNSVAQEMTLDEFIKVPKFRGVLCRIEPSVMPETHFIIPNTGPCVTLVIQSDDGAKYVVKEFVCGLHAKTRLSELVGKRVRSFPAVLLTWTDWAIIS